MSNPTAAQQPAADEDPHDAGDHHRDHRPAGLNSPDPTDTDHPTGKAQAAENAATESPS